jgi:hypothetical protein
VTHRLDDFIVDGRRRSPDPRRDLPTTRLDDDDDDDARARTRTARSTADATDSRRPVKPRG